MLFKKKMTLCSISTILYYLIKGFSMSVYLHLYCAFQAGAL